MVGLKIFDYNMNLTLAKKRVTVELVALNLISLFENLVSSLFI